MGCHVEGEAISIHSLVKRETAGTCKASPSRGDFNPLPRKEGDPRTPLTAP